MKRLTLILSLLPGLLFVACDQLMVEIDETVEISLGYTLSDSNGNSMYGTKSLASDVFAQFYTKITDGTLIAPTFDFTFTEVDRGWVYEVEGAWATDNIVALRPGTYHVVGTSTATGLNLQQTCSITVDTQVTVDLTHSSITLPASYDCALVVFADASVTSLCNYNGVDTDPVNFYHYGSYYYAFVRTALYETAGRADAHISGHHTSGKDFSVSTSFLEFQKGRYYVYNNVAIELQLAYMLEGEYELTTHPSVDLGLSVKWATVNVGADNPWDIGDRYAWGEITTKTFYDWTNYVWCNGTYSSLTKYCSNANYGTVDNKTVLEPADDAARVVWGGPWRMPTKAEAQELFDHCTWTAETNHGVNGYRATAANGESLFFPFNGQFDESGLHNTTDEVQIWTTECTDTYYAYRFRQYGVDANNHKHDGLCIRAVRAY